MMPTTSNASGGWYMMRHCWWGGDLSYLGTASGAPCWWAPSSTSTGITMMWPTVHLIHQPRGIVNRGLRYFAKRGAEQSGHKNASRARRRRSRSSSRCHSRMPIHGDWSRYSCCSPPNMPPRCHCGEPLSPSLNTMPKLSSAMNILAYVRSSCSVEATV